MMHAESKWGSVSVAARERGGLLFALETHNADIVESALLPACVLEL